MNNANLIFTRAGQNDIAELVRMRIYYIVQDYGHLAETDRAKMEKSLPEYFARNLEKNIFAFVAKNGGKIVATAFFLVVEKPASPAFINGKTGIVLNVCTMNEYRAKGIATRLMQMLVDFARQNELNRIDLSATKMGYSVYKKLGFEDLQSEYQEMRLKL